MNFLLNFSKGFFKIFEIQVESISVNPKKSSTTWKSINIYSNNIRKSVCIKKAVFGSYNQENLKYGETAGIQFILNAFTAVCFSAVKNVSIWKPWNLDFILDQGDILMKSLSLYHALAIDELLLYLKIEGSDLEVFSQRHSQ